MEVAFTTRLHKLFHECAALKQKKFKKVAMVAWCYCRRQPLPLGVDITGWSPSLWVGIVSWSMHILKPNMSVYVLLLFCCTLG